MRWTKHQLIQQFSEDKYYAAEEIQIALAEATKKEWMLVPANNLQMISVISCESFDRGQEDVGCIIHDKLIKPVKVINRIYNYI